jgi:hypothetical protein
MSASADLGSKEATVKLRWMSAALIHVRMVLLAKTSKTLITAHAQKDTRGKIANSTSTIVIQIHARMAELVLTWRMTFNALVHLELLVACVKSMLMNVFKIHVTTGAHALTRLVAMIVFVSQALLATIVKGMSMNVSQALALTKEPKSVSNLSMISIVYASQDGWESFVRPGEIFASKIRAKMEVSAPTQNQPTSVFVLLTTVGQTVSIMEAAVPGIHVYMGEHAKRKALALPVSARLELQEQNVSRI